MHATELDQSTPRPVRRRFGAPQWHAGFDPWLTWRIGWQCLSGGFLCALLGWLLLRFETPAAALLIFGALVGLFGVWCAVGGLVNANAELRGERFLVEHGVVATARVVRLEVPHEEMRYEPVFEFRDAQNRLRRGRCSTLRGDEWFQKLAIGDEFDVLYSPRNSRHFVPYAVSIWEVAS